MSAAVALDFVFLAVRYFVRDRLPVRVARVEHQMLQNTVSDNGHVSRLRLISLQSACRHGEGRLCAGGRSGT